MRVGEGVAAAVCLPMIVSMFVRLLRVISCVFWGCFLLPKGKSSSRTPVFKADVLLTGNSRSKKLFTRFPRSSSSFIPFVSVSCYHRCLYRKIQAILSKKSPCSVATCPKALCKLKYWMNKKMYWGLLCPESNRNFVPSHVKCFKSLLSCSEMHLSICQCTTAYTTWPPQCSAGERYDNNNQNPPLKHLITQLTTYF